jgi:hypothetical protein
LQLTFDGIVSNVERWLSVGKSDKPYRDALKLYEGAEM